MEIVVCIKQVPDTTDVKVDPQRKTLMRDGVRSILNPFDAHAIEEALRLRERSGGRVRALTMGPPQARMVLEEAIAMGADEAVLVSHQEFAGSDTLATSLALSSAIEKMGAFDIIICGKQAADGDTAQVGPGIAARLGLPQIVFAKRIVEVEKHTLKAERITEEGFDIVAAPLPCLVTVAREANIPRYPSFAGKVRAKRARIPVWTAADLGCAHDHIGLDGSPTWVDRIFAPPLKEGCQPKPGTPEAIGSVAQEVFEYLEERST